MVNHEQTHLANFSADTPEDIRAEHLVDQGVMNVHDAYAEVLDFDPERPLRRSATAAERAATPRRRYSRRGGWSYNEGSDSENDPFWQNTDLTPVPDTEVLTNRVGVSFIQGVLMGLHEQSRQDAAAAHAAHLEEVRARADEELRRGL